MKKIIHSLYFFIIVQLITFSAYADQQIETYFDKFTPTVSYQEVLNFAETKDDDPSEFDNSATEEYYVIMFNDFIFGKKSLVIVQFNYRDKSLYQLKLIFDGNDKTVFRKSFSAIAERYGQPIDEVEWDGKLGNLKDFKWEMPGFNIRLSYVGNIAGGGTTIRYKCLRQLSQ